MTSLDISTMITIYIILPETALYLSNIQRSTVGASRIGMFHIRLITLGNRLRFSLTSTFSCRAANA